MPNPFNFKKIRLEHYAQTYAGKRLVIEFKFDWDSRICIEKATGTISNLTAKGTVMVELFSDCNISTPYRIGNVKHMKIKFKQKLPDDPDLSITFSRTGLLKSIIFIRDFINWESSEAYFEKNVAQNVTDFGPLMSNFLNESSACQYVFAKIFERILDL